MSAKKKGRTRKKGRARKKRCTSKKVVPEKSLASDKSRAREKSRAKGKKVFAIKNKEYVPNMKLYVCVYGTYRASYDTDVVHTYMCSQMKGIIECGKNPNT